MRLNLATKLSLTVFCALAPLTLFQVVFRVTATFEFLLSICVVAFEEYWNRIIILFFFGLFLLCDLLTVDITVPADNLTLLQTLAVILGGNRHAGVAIGTF